MEQIPSYNLLQAIDPTKIKVPISERFAKLTLSSNKKQQQKCDEEPDQQKIHKEKRDSVARNISKQFDNMLQEPATNVVLNPLLRSDSSKETELDNSVVEELTMEALEVSEDVEQVENNLDLLSQQMASLLVGTKPVSLSSGSTADLSVFTDLLTSESQPSSISEADKIHIVHHIPIIVADAAKQEMIPLSFAGSNDNLEDHLELAEDKVQEERVEEEEQDEEEDEPITISDSSDSYHDTEQDIMTTSSLPSTCPTSENLSLPSLVADKAERVAAFLRDVSIENRVMNELGQLVVNDTVDRILDNKENHKMQESLLKARKMATADTESMTIRDIDEEDLENLEESEEDAVGREPVVKTGNRSANDETVNNTADTELHEVYNDKDFPQKPLKHCSPKAKQDCTDVYRLANDDTECNTDFIFNEESFKSNQSDDFLESSLKENAPTQPSIDHHISQNYRTPDRKKTQNCSVHLTPTNPPDVSIINSSNEEHNVTVPETSITISETDIDESTVEDKSSSKNEDSNDKKLSNSFQRQDESSEDSEDSEYEQKISKIPLSLGINISAKINIKIHIPENTSSSEDDQTYEPSPTADKEEVRTQQWTQLTDETVKDNSEKQQNRLSYEENNAATEENNEISVNADGNMQDEEESAGNNRSMYRKINQKPHDRNNRHKTNKESDAFATPQRPCTQIPTKNPREKMSPNIKKDPNSSPEIVEDEKFLTEAEKLLNQLYGKAWQTPEVIRTLKRSSGSGDKKSTNTKSSSARKKEVMKNSHEETSNKRSLAEETVLQDFSMFRRNIVTTKNLDSTRLATPPESKMPQKSGTLTEPRIRRKPITQKTDLQTQLQTTGQKQQQSTPVAKTIVGKRRAFDDRWRQLIDDTNSEGDNASDDDNADQSWSKNASVLEVNSSDSDFEIPAGLKNKKDKNTTTKRAGRSDKSDYLVKMLNNSKQGEIVYLDLSKDEVEVQNEVPASPPANHDLNFASRLQEILKTCRHEDKAKLPSSNTKSKRKLFTPKFGDDDFENCQPKDDQEKHTEVDKENDNGILDDRGHCPFDSLGRPKVFDLADKHLESVKKGKPIFQLTPTRKEKNTKQDVATPSTKSDSRAKSSDEAKFKTPSTIKAKKQTASALKDLWQLSHYKYSFLKSLDVTVSKSLCDPKALHFRDNYRTKKEELAQILYDMYNEKLFDNKLEVPLLWNKKLINTAGRCLNKKKLGIRSSVVELSEKVLTSGDRLRCTLIHELCHAATWVFNGEGGHGSTWKEWARRANAIFPDIPKIGVCHQYDIEYKYTYKCTLCAAKSFAHSKSKKVENIRCSYCHGAIEVFLNKKDKHGNVTPTPVKEATGFAKFVKDNYKKFKRDDLKHADVMKLLSNEFAALKVTNN